MTRVAPVATDPTGAQRLRTGPPFVPAAVVQRLRERLDSRLPGRVRFDAGARALYATDGSLYRQVPIAVAWPESDAEVVELVAACREAGAPLLPRGGGTSLAGQCCNVAVVVDFSRHLNRVLGVDAGARRARVQPGCVLDWLREAAEEHHLTFAPDPATHAHNTIGGMLGNNSCGVHSVMGGRTADNVHALEILTYDGLRMRVGPTPEDELQRIVAAGGRRGEIYARLRDLRDRYAGLVRERVPQIPRRVSGFNLDQLLPENGFNVARALVGSEGTCVTILAAELELVPSPPARVLLVLGYPDVFHAGDHVPQVLAARPVGLEGIDRHLVAGMRKKGMHTEERALLPAGDGWLLVEFGGGTPEEAEAHARRLMTTLEGADDAPSMKLFVDPDAQQDLWLLRESGLGATAHVPGERPSHPGWEDAAVPPDHVGAYLRDFRALLDQFGYDAAVYGHFGDGCIHCRIDFQVDTEDGVRKWHAFMQEAADLVVRHGGSLSGEHGDGQVRAELLGRMYGPELVEAFREFKSIWDPDGRMNPGKVIDPFPMTMNLRSGPDHHPPLLRTYFDYPEDGHSFAGAVNRCVGIGNCRNDSGGVMCPSFRATREEKHSTRGRARLLFEMVKGGPIADGFRSEAVHEALDLCLACKGCKRDCPVDVDMATYKAEFMARHYRHRLRPRSAYSMGLIWYWSRLAARMPRLANGLLRGRATGTLIKRIGGIATEREMPAYAEETFVAWFRRRGTRNPGGRPVVLWPDTFGNFFQPAGLQAATRVLEAAGYAVRLPARSLCCGRPLYAEGMLELARRQLGDVLDTLEDDLREGADLVGLEPACVTSFRDELPALFPGDERAHRLAGASLLLGELLDRDGFQPSRLARRALVHAHCYHHAVIGTGAQMRVLARAGIEAELLDAGCCGMAGTYGFRAGSYPVSQKIAELQLLPALRGADADTLVITNGFSCREQIRQATGGLPLTLAEVLDMAIAGPRRNPERERTRDG
uniref:FAD-binding protein n=1 Tax=Coralloluteibacterium stylophorae TaxID=1776034 RepID=A0A8J8AXD8_9GAMM